jgi:hypothetical protein
MRKRFLDKALPFLALVFIPCLACSDGKSPSPDAGKGDTTADAANGSALFDEVFDDGTPHEFIVDITQSEWEGITQDMLDYAEAHPIRLLYPGDGREYRTDKYRKADFIYRRPDGSEIKLSEVGIRTRGNESRRLPYQNGHYYKSHFKVKFDETFDMAADAPATQERDKRRFAGMKALNFRWSRYNTYDTYANKSKINEVFSYLLLGKIGVPAPRASLATLKFRIAGKDVNYGLYGIVEDVDKPFLKAHFGSSGGDLYKCLYVGPGADMTESSIVGSNVGVKDSDTNYRPVYDLQTNETTSDHSALKTFVRQLNTLEGQALVDYLDANFEVDAFLRLLAMGMYINNVDDYRFSANNYYLYFNDKGKAAYVPYDFDISLATNWHGELSDADFINQDIFNTTLVPIAWGDSSPRPLVDKILAVGKYRERYRQYLADYLQPKNKLFLWSEYKAKFDQLYAIYGRKTDSDTEDPDPMDLAGYEKPYFFDKTKNVLGQLGLDPKGFEVE